MRKHSLTLATLVTTTLVILIGLPSESRAQTICSLDRNDPRVIAAERSAVRVRDDYIDDVHGVGSGVILGRHHVLTNAHVAYQRTEERVDPVTKKKISAPVARILRVCVQTEPLETCYVAEVVMIRAQEDLALLHTEAELPAGQRLVQKQPEKYECDFVDTSIGSLMCPVIVSGPYLGRADARHDPQRHWVFDISINPGGSGGPVFDGRTGELIGVVVAVSDFKDGRPMAIVIPGDVIGPFLQAAIAAKVLPPDALVK